MPRRNQSKRARRRHFAPEFKGKGMKRPRSFHHGPERDEHWREAERRFRAAEEGAA